MNSLSESVDAPPRELRFRRSVRLRAAVRELWHARELVVTLAERDLRARYKQTVLGFLWAILIPVIMMLVFTFLFQKVAKVDTGGTPYPLFAYLGLLPWTFFSSSVSTGGQTLRANGQLLNKVYCPREVFPLASMVVAAVDTAISVSILLLLFVITGVLPKPTSAWVPVLVVVQVVFTAGVVLVISSLSVYFRDIRHALPILLQVGLFATPVAYGLDAIPSSLQQIYALFNPLGPLIDGYRRTVLLGQGPDWSLVALAATAAVVWMVAGYAIFKRLETGFADVA
jgi:ABC-type polysaccharide/polyol phosphate export permease